MSQTYQDQLPNLLSAYLDDELTPAEKQWLERELAQSAELRADLDSLRHTVDLLGQLPRVSAPRPFTLSEADVGRSVPRTSWLIRPNWAWGLSVAALLLVGGVTFFLTDLSKPTAGIVVENNSTVNLGAKSVAPKNISADWQVEPRQIQITGRLMLSNGTVLNADLERNEQAINDQLEPTSRQAVIIDGQFTLMLTAVQSAPDFSIAAQDYYTLHLAVEGQPDVVIPPLVYKP